MADPEESDRMETRDDELARIGNRNERRPVGGSHVGLGMISEWLRRTSKWGELAAPAAAVGLALWISTPAWGTGPFHGVDSIAHAIRVTFGVENIFARGHLDGWFPGVFLGHQHFLFRGPGLSLIVALVRLLTFGQLPTIAALNLVTLGCFVLFPLAVVFLARSLGIGRRESGIAGILSLLVSNPFGVGIHGLFEMGLMENQVGAVFFCFALGSLMRVASGASAHWVVVGAMALSGLAVSHLLSTLVLSVFATLYVPWFVTKPKVRNLARLLLTGALSAGLAAFWLMPLLAHRDLHGAVAGPAMTGLLETLSHVARGELLFRPRVLPVVLAGWAFVAFRVWIHGEWRVISHVVVASAYLVLTFVSFRLLPTDVTAQLPIRGQGYAAVLATFPLAYLLVAATRPLGVFGEALAISAAAALFLVPLGPLRQVVRPLSDPAPPLQEAAAVLARVVPNGARFASPTGYPAEAAGYGFYHPAWWLAWRSGRNCLTGLALESTSTPWVIQVPEDMSRQPPDEAADALARLGVTHVVAPSASLVDHLAASSRFRLVWDFPPMGIFAVSPRTGHPHPSSLFATEQPAAAVLQGVGPEEWRFEASSEQPTPATIAIAWSPKWQLTLNDHPHPLGRSPDGLLTLMLPPGTSRIALAYRRDGWDRLGLILTALSVGGVLGWLGFSRKFA